MTPDNDTDYTIHNWKTIPVYQSFRKSLNTDMLHGTCVHGAPIGKIKSRTPKEFRERGSVMFDRSYILAYLNNAVSPFNCVFDDSIVDELASAPILESGHPAKVLGGISGLQNDANFEAFSLVASIIENFKLSNSTATSERNIKAYKLIELLERVIPSDYLVAAKKRAVTSKLNGKNV